jgi:hypothetical protein
MKRRTRSPTTQVSPALHGSGWEEAAGGAQGDGNSEMTALGCLIAGWAEGSGAETPLALVWGPW